MMVLGERYDARTLFEKGVAWRVVPDARLKKEAHAVAEKLLALSQRSLRAMKRTLNQIAVIDFRHAWHSKPMPPSKASSTPTPPPASQSSRNSLDGVSPRNLPARPVLRGRP